jgi:probable HAF family extracellular repeat protein
MRTHLHRRGIATVAASAVGLFALAGCNADMGTLGGASSSAVDINNHGQAVGTAATAAGPADNFRWDTTTKVMVDLTTTAGPAPTVSGITDAGDIVAGAGTSLKILHPGGTTWTTVSPSVYGGSLTQVNVSGDSTVFALLTVSGQMSPTKMIALNAATGTLIAQQDLPHGWTTRLGQSNDHGQVAVTSIVPGTTAAASPFVWDAHSNILTQLSPPGPSAYALGLNNAGQLLIQEQTSGSSYATYFLYDPTTQSNTPVAPTVQFPLGYSPTVAPLDDAGHAVIPGMNSQIWRIDVATGATTALERPATGGLISVFGANEQGDVVGSSSVSSMAQHAMIWYHP